MTSQPLNRSYVGIVLTTENYAKVAGVIPTPSYRDKLQSYKGEKQIIIYVIDGSIVSARQFKWLGDIKLSLGAFLMVEFEELEEFYFTDTTEGAGTPYSLQELHKAFRAEYKRYPKIFYPADKKALYRHLVLHGKKLRHKRLFTLEAMTSAGLIMNGKLKDKLSIKELHKKVKGAFGFIMENKENFREGLSVEDLRKAHQRGAAATSHKRSQSTREKIIESLKSGDYVKSNGKINQTLLANDMNLHRNTIASHLKDMKV